MPTTPIQSFHTLPDSAFVRLSTVASLLGCSPSTVWRGVKRGRLPLPVKHCERVTAWNVGELQKS